MPKDTEEAVASASASASDKAPLKRGDACLYCRKRRIRCSAHKPTCDHCKKLRRDCVYDTGKPVSRVKQLEDKVAELEALLVPTNQNQHSSTASGSGSGSGSGQESRNGSIGDRGDGGWGDGGFTMGSNMAIFGESTQYSLPTQSTTAMDFSNIPLSSQPMPSFNLFSGFGAAGLGVPDQSTSGGGGTGQQQSIFPQYNGLDIPIEDTFDFSMLDPGFMNLVNSFSGTSTGADTYLPSATPIPSGPGPGQGDGQVGGDGDGGGGDMQVDPISGGLDESDLFNLFTNVPSDIFQGSGPSSGSTGFTPTNFDPSSGSTGFTPPSGNSSSSPTWAPAAPQESVPFAPLQTSFQAFDIRPTAFNRATTGVNGNINSSLSNGLGLDGKRSPRTSEPDRRTRTFGLAMASRVDETSVRSDPVLDGLPLVGGWFDAADLPTVARDHLLDIFFSGMKVVGQEFHIPRFLASLSLPPAKRPHPCLLYTMYLLASRASTHPPIRALETHFYSIALQKLEEAVAQADRILDATRAATMLAVYKYGLAKYHEGYMMTGMAARLALSAGLHQIPSSVFKPSVYSCARQSDAALMRQRAYILGQPTDPFDLGERIWAFWAVYTVDRCGAISAQWPCAIPDDIISTPFPKPLHEYELGLVSARDNLTMSSTWTAPSPYTTLPPIDPNTKYGLSILHLRALSILERASKLMYLPPEPGWDAHLYMTTDTVSPGGEGSIDEFLRWQNSQAARASSAGTGIGAGGGMGAGVSVGVGANGGTTGAPLGGLGWESQADSRRGWTKTAKIRTPKAYAQVREALERMESDLPVDRRTDWESWDGRPGAWHFTPGPKKEAVTLHFVEGCAWMFLFDVFSFAAENTLAVNVARRLTGTIRLVLQEDSYAEMDVFIAMVWSFLVKILIREAKRLHMLGEMEAAKPIEGEIDIVVQALKKVGLRYNVGQMQALRADRYRKTAGAADYLRKEEEEDRAENVRVPSM